MLSIKIKLFELKLKKRRAIVPVLVIPALLVGLKIVDIMLDKRKKK